MRKSVPTYKGKIEGLADKYPDKIPRLTEINKTGYGTKTMGYRLGTDNYSISAGQKIIFDSSHPFAQLHFGTKGIADFNKNFNVGTGNLLVSGDSQNGNINIDYSLNPALQVISDALRKAYIKQSNYPSQFKGIDAYKRFPLWIPK